MPTQVTETRATGAAPVQEAGSGRMEILVISPGWGSSGYYSQEVLEAAGRDGVWAEGTQCFLDHPSATEQYDRPERSVRDLAAVLTEDATWRDGVGLVAPIRTFGPYREALAEMADAIGMSIRASAEAEAGEAEGRKGMIITRLIESPANSVDFVTRAGRGGKVLSVLESARHPAAEATVNDRRDALQAAVGDAHGGDRVWVWVRDFDPEAGVVYFDVESGGDYGTYSQAYTTTDDGAVTLTGDRTEVRPSTTYVPAQGATNPPAPAGASEAAPAAEPPTPTKENPMGSIQVDEARVRDLEEKAGLVPALEARATAAEERADAAEERARQAEAGTYARDFARKIVTRANGDLAEASVARIVKSALAQPLPLDESGRLDTDAFTPLVEEARTDEETYLGQVAEASGAGRVRGVGQSNAPESTVSESDADAAIARAFGRKGA